MLRLSAVVHEVINRYLRTLIVVVVVVVVVVAVVVVAATAIKQN